jgi:hypothetical protein
MAPDLKMLEITKVPCHEGGGGTPRRMREELLPAGSSQDATSVAAIRPPGLEPGK